MNHRRLQVSACLVLACNLGWPQWTLAAQQPVFRTKVDVVRVDVLVTSRGRPVSGLTAADFEIKDNGVLQEVHLATTAGGVNVILALDTSSSMEGEAIHQLKEASCALVRSLQPNDTITVLAFSDRLKMLAETTSQFGGVARDIERIDAGGRTAVRDALYAAMSLAPDSGRSVLILFTDGADNGSWLTEAAVLESIGRHQSVVYVVAGAALDPRAVAFVRKVADAGAGDLLRTESQDLGRTFGRVLDEFRSRYLLSYVPTGVKRDDGWHRLTVTLKDRAGRVRARERYFAGQDGR